MESFLHAQLLPLYKAYNEHVKPLIADIEWHYEKFPLPIFNEIRAFNDHVARCYSEQLDQRIIEKQISKAKSHIERILLDCYKYLNVALYDKTITKFERWTRYIDIAVIDNGEFYPKYKTMRNNITINLKKAKMLERKNDKNEAILLYESVYNSYNDLYDLQEEYRLKINWAIAKFTTKKVITFLGWLGAAIISGIVSSLVVPWGEIIAIFR